MDIKNIKNINLIPKNLSKLNKIYLSSVMLGTFAIGFITGTSYGVKEEREAIFQEMDERVKSIQDLEKELTSDVVTLMQTQSQLSRSANQTCNTDENTYRLDEIYVLDTKHEDVITFGESSNYAYPYIFTTCKEIPTVNGHDNHDSFAINGFYDILFADTYTSITSNSEATTNGNFYIENSGDYDEVLNHMDPLIYYLTEEEIKASYTESELKSLFYRLNSEELVKGKVLENKKKGNY